MKTTSYKNYKCNGFTLKYYSKSYIRDGVYYGECVVAYYNGRRIVECPTSENRGLYSIICRLSDEERRRTTDTYIHENAARMGVAPCILEAHIEEVQKKNCRVAVPAPKMELTAADIALYDYAMGGDSVDGYTIGNADAVLKLMKKEGITPAAVNRARKKMKKQQPAPAAPVVDAPAADDAPAAPVIDAPAADTPAAADADVLAARAALIKEYEAIKQQAFDRIKSNYEEIKQQAAAEAASRRTAADEYIETGAYPVWYNTELECESLLGCKFKVVSWGRKQVKIEYTDGERRIYKVRDFIDNVECGNITVSAPYDAEYMAKLHAKLNQNQPAPAPAADAAAEVEKVEEKAPAFVTVGDIASPNITLTTPANPRPEVGEVGDRVKYKYGDIEGTITQSWYHDIYLNEWRCTVVLDDGKEIHPSIESITILPAAAPVVDAPAADTPTPAVADMETTPTSEKTAADEYIKTGAYPIWYERNLQIEHIYNRGKYMGTGTENIGTVVSWGRKQIKVAWITGKKNVYTIRDFFEMVESGKFIVSMPYDAEYMAYHYAKLNQKQPAPAPAAPVADEAAVDEAKPAAAPVVDTPAVDAAPAADTFADAITAYCAALEEPAAPAWDNTPAADEQPAPAPRARRRLNIAPRLSRWLHPARWVAVAFVVCLMSGLLLGMNTSTAADAAADDIAAVHELPAITVTASSFTTAPAVPSPAKKLATPSPVKKAAADAVTLPGQKTASDIATATAPAADDAVTPSNQKTASDIAAVTDATAAADADGLTICAGTAWAYEMMHWA